MLWRILTDAATLGKVDILRGFKENVITGHLIPAGTGAERFQNLQMKKLGEEIPVEPPEPKAEPRHSEENVQDIDFGDDVDDDVDEIFSDRVMDADEAFDGKSETEEFPDDYDGEKKGVFDDDIDDSEFYSSKDYENENDKDGK